MKARHHRKASAVLADPAFQEVWERFNRVKRELEAHPVPEEHRTQWEAFLKEMKASVFGPFILSLEGNVNIANYFKQTKASERRLRAYEAIFTRLLQKHPVVEILQDLDFEQKMKWLNTL